MTHYRYGAKALSRPNALEKPMTDEHEKLLFENPSFCIYPWVHLHVYPNGKALPCCMADDKHTIGDTKKDDVKVIWNSPQMKQIRINMIQGKSNPGCERCYEKEKHGFISGRIAANKDHGHHVARVDATKPDGHLDEMKMTYWDFRFSNLCNLKCRTCGEQFSSQWHGDMAKLYEKDKVWRINNPALLFAGKSEEDLLGQLLEHIDDVESIYFAGGEPLIMEQHYLILEELLRKNKSKTVGLTYNTNLTKLAYKDKDLLKLWREFSMVSIGASLDAMGPRAEYIRKNCDWNEVESNAWKIKKECPHIDFYISATLSLMNAFHIPDFHYRWALHGLIRPQDFHINLLQGPEEYRVDVATPAYKKKIRVRYETHLNWLEGKDPIDRATLGYKAALNFMDATDNSHLLPAFWNRTEKLDEIRNESWKDCLPELASLK